MPNDPKINHFEEFNALISTGDASATDLALVALQTQFNAMWRIPDTELSPMEHTGVIRAARHLYITLRQITQRIPE